MQPLSGLTASGHASAVMPSPTVISAASPSPPVSVAPVSPPLPVDGVSSTAEHPARTKAPAAATAKALVMGRVFLMMSSLCLVRRGGYLGREARADRSVAERPGLEVGADPVPEPEQSAWFDGEEEDDEATEEQRLELEDRDDPLASTTTDEGQVGGEPLQEAGEEDDEGGTDDRAGHRRDATDDDDGEQLDREEDVPLLRHDPADEHRHERPGEPGIGRAEDEGQCLGPQQVDAHDLGGDVAVPDRGGGPSRAAARQVAGHDAEADEQDQTDEVERDAAVDDERAHRIPDREVVAEQDRLGHAPAHAGASGERSPLFEQLLTEHEQAEREDREVEAPHPHGKRRDDESHDGLHQGSQWQRDREVHLQAPDRGPRRARDHRRRIGAEGHEERVTE